MSEKNNNNKTQLETNQILSSRKRIEEILCFMFQDSASRLTRSDIRDILELTSDAKTAKDFFTTFGVKVSSGDEFEKIYEDFKLEKDTLQDLGVNITDLFVQDSDGNFEFSSQYDREVQKSLIKMAHLDRELNVIGTEVDFKKNKKSELESEPTDEKIQKFSKMFNKRRDEMIYGELDEKNISPNAQQIVRGISRYEALKKQKNEAIDNNYFDWYASNLMYLHNLRKSLVETKSLVITKGLEKVIEEVRDTKNQTGKPAFIQGDLGCGKTEVALHVGRVNNKQNFEKIKEYYEKEGYEVISAKDSYKKFLNISNQEREKLVDLVCEKYPDKSRGDISNNQHLLFKNFQIKRSNEDKKIDEELITEPIVLSGHKEFDPAQFIGGFEIRQNESNPQEMTKKYLEFLKKITKEIEDDQEMGDVEKENIKQDLRDMMKNQLSNKGIETHAYLGKLLEAMKVGKTVIIDEVNAIPHEVLIILNHYLTRKVGDIVTPPINSLQPFKIAKGFEVILTGNIPKDGQTGYLGRQSLDAAFLSRLNIIEMDYLNNARENDITHKDKLPPKYVNELETGLKTYNEILDEYYESLSNDDKAIIRRGGKLEVKLENKKDTILCNGKENDELYHVLSVFGIPRSYVAHLPENYFDKLYQLARVSRLIQDAFSGKYVDSKYYGEGSKKPQSFLKNAVPSMRHLTNIIKAWKADGYSRDLDFYLWKYFIQQQTGEEKKWVYQLFKQFGGFFKADVFKDHEKNLDLNLQGKITKDELIPKNETNFKTFSQVEILEKLFGPAPRIDEKTATILDSISANKQDLEKEKHEMIQEIDANIFLMNDFIETYSKEIMDKYCADQCPT